MGKTGAMGMSEGDRITYMPERRSGIAGEFTKDGDVTITFDDGEVKAVKWNHCWPEDQYVSFTFDHLRKLNNSRCHRWHPGGGIMAWTPERWFTAMTGEVGELGNAMKKGFRVQDQIANINEPGRQLSDMRAVRDKIAQEIGDIAIYLDLLAQRYDLRLDNCIARVFNAKSVEYGFPERL